MDLGLQGRTALVCAASKGLGRAVAFALAREGVALVITARGAEALNATAEAIRIGTGAHVRVAPGDITTEAGQSAALAAAGEAANFITQAGRPPPPDSVCFNKKKQPPAPYV
jgi:3-oxoacyl-[acyl-carrier protein] reductase